MTHHLTRILCAAEPRGDVAAVERLLATAAEIDAHAVAVVGDLAASGGRTSLREVFRALGRGGLPTFWVPGPGDAPIAGYLHEAHDVGLVHPELHGVHGTAAVAPDGQLLFAGLGGEIDDDPEAPREEEARLRYARWEPAYRLRVLEQLDGQEPVLLFHTPPAHKGRDAPGSEVVAELTATYRARLVVCGGERMTELIGRTLVVAPGSLTAGQYALVDLHAHEARLADFDRGATTTEAHTR
jgi:Icc-related predicted phosphoesterase